MKIKMTVCEMKNKNLWERYCYWAKIKLDDYKNNFEIIEFDDEIITEKNKWNWKHAKEDDSYYDRDNCYSPDYDWRYHCCTHDGGWND